MWRPFHVILLVGLVLGGGLRPCGVLAEPTTDYEFCVDDAGADRIQCTADYLTLKAECVSDRAFSRYIDLADADAQYALCLDEALTAKLLCRDDIERCTP